MEKETINAAIEKAVGFTGDFTNSLDAMHEAEKVMKREEHGIYAYHIQMITGMRHTDSPLVLISATAAQRAEAFLRTLNLWTE